MVVVAWALGIPPYRLRRIASLVRVMGLVLDVTPGGGFALPNRRFVVSLVADGPTGGGCVFTISLVRVRISVGLHVRRRTRLILPFARAKYCFRAFLLAAASHYPFVGSP